MACWSRGEGPLGELGNDAVCALEIERRAVLTTSGGFNGDEMWRCVVSAPGIV